jgi:ABC-type branched-subunit amino acid transport system permease subunit
MLRKTLYGLLLIGLIAAPFLGVYPVFMMRVLCFALFAAAFNLLIGYTGLLSFGHAMFLACSAARRWRPCWASWSACSPSGGRASTSR